MRRREFVTLIGGTALWPSGPRLHPSPANRQRSAFSARRHPQPGVRLSAAFLQRMRELGWIDGYNIAIQYRWAEGREDRYIELAADLVRLKVDIIVTGGTAAVIAVKRATSTIPIVFATAGDPVGTGLVKSLAHPGGNVTGLSNQQTDLGGYRLELLHEAVPSVKRVAVMGNVSSPNVLLEMDAVRGGGDTARLEFFQVEIKKAEDIVPGVESIKGRADALYICTDPLVTMDQVRINTLAIKQGLPTINAFRQYVDAGALMSYGPNFPDLFRRAADFVDKILHGAKPGDLPVEQPVKFDLFVNSTTANALGLRIPESFLVRAKEVIE